VNYPALPVDPKTPILKCNRLRWTTGILGPPLRTGLPASRPCLAPRRLHGLNRPSPDGHPCESLVEQRRTSRTLTL